MFAGNLNELTLSTCADDTHIVYINGKQVNSNPRENAFDQAIITPIPRETKVIAVSITNYEGGAGFKAALSDNSVVSDDSWKCSSTFSENWQKIDFDDRSWPAALTIGSTRPTACGGFPSSAKYLWTDESYTSLITIYCRKTLDL